MFSNYFTLKKFVSESLTELVDYKFLQAYSQRKNKLTLEFSKGEEIRKYDFCVHSKIAGFVPQKFLKRARQSIEFFQELKGKKITKILLDSEERIIRIEIEERELIFRIFGKDSNVFLVKDEICIDAFKRLGFIGGQKFETKKRVGNIFPNSEFQIWENAFTESELEPEKFLQKKVNHLGKTLAQEILFRTNEKTLEEIYNVTQEVLKEFVTSKAKIYLDENAPVKFSLCELKSLGKMEFQEFENLEEAVQFFGSKFEKAEAFQNRKGACKKVLSSKKKSATKALKENYRVFEKPDNSAELRKFGEMILAYFHEVKQGQKSVTLNDFETGEPIEIQLNPEFAPDVNAKNYFKRSKKQVRAIEGAEKRINELEPELEVINSLLEELEESKTFKEIASVEQKLAELGFFTSQNAPNKKIGKSITKKYREVDLGENWNVWVGRNKNENDELTLKVAKKDDWFFHFYGGAGSHVILRQEGRKGNPPSYIFEKAASVAAFYSDGKHSSVAPVTYTQVKHVSKPRKAPKGLVKLKFEKILYVEPKKEF
ncbi:MAG: DUF814 domain-containing protein [Calditrichaeota bacterium]|nr:MAG: DUF814 domain-containing protein [Calditrichota bacterium]